MTLQEFINKYNGVGNVGNTTENKGECVGLVMVWAKDQGLPHVWGHAFSLLTNADPNAYEVIKNTPDAVVQPGDIVVWGKGFNGTFGHTAIATKGTINTLEVFEQNSPTGSPCRLHTYKSYAYIDGWLRSKNKPAQVQPTKPQEITLDTVYDFGSGGAVVKGKKTLREVDDAFRRKQELEGDNSKLAIKLEEMDKEITDLENQLNIKLDVIRERDFEITRLKNLPPVIKEIPVVGVKYTTDLAKVPSQDLLREFLRRFWVR